jgi:HPr kinase/phosphorylase
MNKLRTLNDLVERMGARLELRWLTPPPQPPRPLLGGDGALGRQSLVGPLNGIHPNRLQVIGQAEQRYLEDMSRVAREDAFNRLLASQPAGIILANGIDPDPDLLAATRRLDIPLLASPLPDEPGLTGKDKELLKKYENRFVAQKPSADYVIDRINNGLYR